METRLQWFLIAASAILIALGVLWGCATLPVLVRPHPGRIQWTQEPTVGTDWPGLREHVQWALDEWGRGLYVGGCRYADICVTRGPIERGVYGRAYIDHEAGTCEARIRVQTWEVVAHEIGHCLGLGHSSHSRSVMRPRARAWWGSEEPYRYVTISDRQVLTSILP